MAVTLDEMERLARRMESAMYGNGPDAYDLCRAVLRLLPVVRAAERYTDTARELQTFARRGATSLAACSEHEKAHADIMIAIDAMRAEGRE